MLLVVFAPLISRALSYPMVVTMQAPDAHAEHPGTVESATLQTHHVHHDMGHVMDHSMMTMPDSATTAKPAKSADPHAEHEMGVDCEYCLIAARMISLLVALLLLIITWPPMFRALAGLVDTQRSPAQGTLGARGPPALTF